MKTMFKHLPALAFVLIVSCVTPTEKQVNSPVSVPTPITTDVSYCDAAEAHLIALGCPEGQPTKRGTRFADVCRELLHVGIYANPKCLVSAKSCSEIDSCTNSNRH